jgi:adenylate cyclase
VRKGSKVGLDILVPFLAGVLMLGVNLLGFRTIEWRIYDLLLHLRPAVSEHEAITLLVVDDTTINTINMYPLSRDFMAEGLIVLSELGAKYTTFDVEFVDKSPRGVDAAYLESELPQQFGLAFSEIEKSITDLFRALQEKRISVNQAAGLVDELTSSAVQEKDQLLSRVTRVARDNDAYLGGAVGLFGNTVLTVNALDWKETTTSDDLRAYAMKELALKDARLVSGSDPIAEAQDIKPAILPVIQKTRLAGFPRVIVDADGVQRRVDILYRYQGSYFPQLGLAGLLDWLGNPSIEIHPNRVVLKNAKHPDRGVMDISIPLASDGKFLINWPRKLFRDSFRQVSFYQAIEYRRLERDLAQNLQLMDQEGYLGFGDTEGSLLEQYRAIAALERDLLSGGADRSLLADYRQAHEAYLADVGAFLLPKGDAALGARTSVEEKIRQEYGRLLESAKITAEQKGTIRQLLDYASSLFEATRGVHSALVKQRAALTEALKDKFVVIGYTGTSTTDIGVNPFEGEYMNVGTHASVVNTILSGEFLDDMPWWVSVLLGLAFALLVTLVISRMEPLPSILVGFGFVVIVVVGVSAFFIFTGTYIGVLTPTFVIFLTFVALSLMKFLRTEKEKGFIRNAFSHYLSNDVINDLLTNPDKLNLGGEKKNITAMFTDLKGFSTISEALDPQDLVRLLNIYLTEMSDTIMKQRGTIDKYEGDAIIAFFGAPVDYKDHAERACYAACRMKSLEIELNKRVLENKMAPSPLLTRIGINTGDMVVGNMGSNQKMDYTMMGNAVNLAARLEGVNKQYGTWILMSEATHREAGASYICRKLDRVRVVGINEPVRLYELVGNKQFVTSEKKEIVDRFHAAMDVFEAKDWEKAAGMLKEILRIDAEDGPSGVYAKRCAEFLAKAPPANWDGVFNLMAK